MMMMEDIIVRYESDDDDWDDFMDEIFDELSDRA
jgi:hypothetical protein